MPRCPVDSDQPRLRHPLPILISLCVLMSVSAGVWAQDRGGGRGGRGPQTENGRGPERLDDIRRAPPTANISPLRERRVDRSDALADSVRRIERSTRGQVLSAERMQSDGRDVNRIKVMDDRGRVRVYMDDPNKRAGGRTRGDDN